MVLDRFRPGSGGPKSIYNFHVGLKHSWVIILEVLNVIFILLLGPPHPPGGPGGGSGLPCSQEHSRFGADYGPNPGIFNQLGHRPIVKFARGLPVC